MLSWDEYSEEGVANPNVGPTSIPHVEQIDDPETSRLDHNASHSAEALTFENEDTINDAQAIPTPTDLRQRC